MHSKPQLSFADRQVHWSRVESPIAFLNFDLWSGESSPAVLLLGHHMTRGSKYRRNSGGV